MGTRGRLVCGLLASCSSGRSPSVGYHCIHMDAMKECPDGRRLTKVGKVNVVDADAPVVVLVHGGRHDGWCWHLVQERLSHSGIESIAPDLPTTGIDDEIDAVREVLDRIDRPVFLVGHSRGGRVLSAAASGRPNVRGLIYVTAMLLEEHELYPAAHPRKSATAAAAPVDADFLRHRMYHDVPDDLLAEALTHLHPVTAESLALAPQPTPAAWRSIYATYVVCTDDRYVEPPLQRSMARHADQIIELAASHAPFLSKPNDLADIIAEQVRRQPAKPHA